jgi:hypothetical protein
MPDESTREQWRETHICWSTEGRAGNNRDVLVLWHFIQRVEMAASRVPS